MDWSFALSAFISLFAVMDPIGVSPAFLVLAPEDRAGRRRAILTAIAVVLAVLITFALVGEPLLLMFGVTLPAFRTAGGIVVMLMGLAMLNGRLSAQRQNPQEADELSDRQGAAIVPLAIPLLAGPAAITTVILIAQDASDLAQQASLMTVIVLCCVLTGLIFAFASQISGWLGRTGINVLNRIIGLLLAAIGVQFIGDGLKGMLPGLAGG